MTKEEFYNQLDGKIAEIRAISAEFGLPHAVALAVSVAKTSEDMEQDRKAFKFSSRNKVGRYDYNTIIVNNPKFDKPLTKKDAIIPNTTALISLVYGFFKADNLKGVWREVMGIIVTENRKLAEQRKAEAEAKKEE